MNRCLRLCQTVAPLLLLATAASAFDSGDKPTITTIDTYGLHEVRKELVLEAVGLQVGDSAPSAQETKSIVERLQAIPGVQRAAAIVVTARSQKAEATKVETILYVGVLEAGKPSPSYRAAPSAIIVLPAIIVDTYREFEAKLKDSTHRGNFSSDSSHGYALLGDATAREIQQQLVPLTDQYYGQILEVLNSAEDAKQRATAAWMLGYASDKKQAMADLGIAVRDPNGVVRNNAMRVLGVFVEYAQKHPELAIEGPLDWYLEMLESVTWSDRNKALMVLCNLDKDRNPALIAMLRERSLPSLIEMSRWNLEGHAVMAFLLVGRVARMTDEEIYHAWTSSQRESLITRALETQAHHPQLSNVP